MHLKKNHLEIYLKIYIKINNLLMKIIVKKKIVKFLEVKNMPKKFLYYLLSNILFILI